MKLNGRFVAYTVIWIFRFSSKENLTIHSEKSSKLTKTIHDQVKLSFEVFSNVVIIEVELKSQDSQARVELSHSTTSQTLLRIITKRLEEEKRWSDCIRPTRDYLSANKSTANNTRYIDSHEEEKKKIDAQFVMWKIVSRNSRVYFFVVRQNNCQGVIKQLSQWCNFFSSKQTHKKIRLWLKCHERWNDDLDSMQTNTRKKKLFNYRET